MTDIQIRDIYRRFPQPGCASIRMFMQVPLQSHRQMAALLRGCDDSLRTHLKARANGGLPDETHHSIRVVDTRSEAPDDPSTGWEIQIVTDSKPDGSEWSARGSSHVLRIGGFSSSAEAWKLLEIDCTFADGAGG